MNECSKCIHQTTPSGHQCYTMERLLKEKLEDRPYIPANVIPALHDIAKFCERYEE